MGSVSGFQLNEAEAIVGGIADGVVVDVAEVVVLDDVENVAGEMVKVAGMLWPLLVAPTPKTVMDAVYVPVTSPVRSAVAVSVSDVVPDAVPVEGASVSHEADVLTLQFKVPLPELEMLTVWTGLVSPCVTEKAKLVGLELIVEPNTFCLP